MAFDSSLSDEELVNSANQGNLDAFTFLYRRYFGIVYSRVCYIIPESDVEDVIQEIFIALLRSIKNYEAKALFRTWFRTLITRQIAEYYRNRNRGETRPPLQLDDIENLPDHSISRDEVEAQLLVQKALNELPDHYREIILMRFAEDLSFDEISKLINRHPEGTKSLFRRAIGALSQKLEETDVRETN